MDAAWTNSLRMLFGSAQAGLGTAEVVSPRPLRAGMGLWQSLKELATLSLSNSVIKSCIWER